MPGRAYNTKGLSCAWEGDDLIRTRIREQGKLMAHPPSQKIATCSISNAKLNQQVLKPALVRLKQSAGKIPLIDNLIPECEELYAKCAREVESDAGAKDAWSLRRMLSWLKRKAKRMEVSNVFWLHLRTQGNVFVHTGWRYMQAKVGSLPYRPHFRGCCFCIRDPIKFQSAVEPRTRSSKISCCCTTRLSRQLFVWVPLKGL